MDITERMSTADKDEQLKLLALSLQARLGRLPTEEEVENFIFGDTETRMQIWNLKE